MLSRFSPLSDAQTARLAKLLEPRHEKKHVLDYAKNKLKAHISTAVIAQPTSLCFHFTDGDSKYSPYPLLFERESCFGFK